MDEGVTDRLYGNYRAEVIDNKDTEMFGRVKIWIPDLMPEVEKEKGLWARPANNPAGGRNLDGDSENYYAGTCYIPKKGAWVWIFFEAGNINRPYYFGALDLQNAKVLPENQVGTNYEDKWTIFKSHKGRTIVISDDPDDERVEITGKKAYLASNTPEGNVFSVYRIEDNMNTILLDEREGKEKILIKTRLGDFIHIDIEDRDLEIKFARDIHIEAGGNIFVKTQGDMHFIAGKSIFTSAHDEINTISGHRMNIETGEEYNRKVHSHSVEEVTGKKITKTAGDVFLESGGDQNFISGTQINRDAPLINDNCAASSQAPNIKIDTIVAEKADAKGDRDT
jgi:hypothetical protein